MSDTPVKPYLISKDDEGAVRLTLRETRFNSQGYPWVLATLVDQTFATATAARTYAAENFGATRGQFANG
jgi:hypothetical protein